MIKLFTFAANRPDFIGLQMHSFRKHLKEDFELVVFNNSRFDTTGGADYDGIHQRSREAGATVIDVEKDPDLIERCQKIELSGPIFNRQGLYTSANVAHAYALCWAWENYVAKEKGAVGIIDSDVFLVEPIKLTDALVPHVMRNIPDGKPHVDGRTFMYMWPTFFLADMARLKEPLTLNWWCGRIEGVPVDVGGQTYHYFQAHPELDVAPIKRSYSGQPLDYDEFYLNDATILHYRSGSNWNHKSREYHEGKTNWRKERIG
jgi:hypothetical protein